MTIIVGLVHNDTTYIGADSLGSNTYSKTVRKDKKLFHLQDRSEIVCGFTHSYRMGQLLMYAEDLISDDDLQLNRVDHRYMVNKFIPNVINLFEINGFGTNKSGEKWGGNFLIGVKNKLYHIEEDYQVGESTNEFDACGSGQEFALGSLHSTRGIIDDPVTRILMALRAASEFSTGCAPPYYIINTKNEEVWEYRL